MTLLCGISEAHGLIAGLWLCGAPVYMFCMRSNLAMGGCAALPVLVLKYILVGSAAWSLMRLGLMTCSLKYQSGDGKHTLIAATCRGLLCLLSWQSGLLFCLLLRLMPKLGVAVGLQLLVDVLRPSWHLRWGFALPDWVKIGWAPLPGNGGTFLSQHY
ncbi:hypothetical protein Nepgr_012459 [Nepenthes gracilis]|uniref:Uncharacterized protein n=1 Tax=Nepenthes gracilis TaxID=150966 RepID=A0AAD3XN39_NEPGR|nr:hypothetical protein Nepgr_012459 [Nepenthes gracilis]